jgi:hypothetical protein
VVLIVCEGTKTEPHYLYGLRSAYALSNANIVIAHSGATDPKSIVEFALKEITGYDRAYCVFDRDGHQTYDPALTLIAQSSEGKAGRLMAVTSWPCFEIWVLLHFAYSTAPYAISGNRSACDNVLAEVQKHMTNYTKGYKGVFEALAPRLDTALLNATKLEKHNQTTQTTNPHTRMHELVNALKGLKKA